MTEGTPKAIEPKGIVRNATKIGVQDGQAEDLINLRFMDGSWRASGNGRQIENMPTGTIYEQLYVHTNVYHHLLGVDNGVLYWFAEIDNDGVTFYPLDGTSDRSLWPEDKQDLPTERVALTNVVGDIWITQTGHLLTVIDEADDFEFFVFKTDVKKYIEKGIDVNSKTTDRSLYPFGQVHFNLYSPSDENDYKHVKVNDATWNYATIGIAHADMLELYRRATNKNQFTRPFLAVAACRLYDGSFAFASQPVLLFPRELTGLRKNYYREVGYLRTNGEYVVTGKSNISLESLSRRKIGFTYQCTSFPYLTNESAVVTLENIEALARANTPKAAFINVDVETQAGNDRIIPIPFKSLPVYSSGLIYNETKLVSCVFGSDLVLSLENYDFIDGSAITELCIFVTPQADVFNMAADGYKDSYQYNGSSDNLLKDTAQTRSNYFHRNDDDVPDADTRSTTIATYVPGLKSEDKIIYDLFHSNFYLLKSYDKDSINKLRNNPIIKLTEVEDANVLSSILDQEMLSFESLARTVYLPKVSYMFNGRLHIANYKSYPYFGYPIDLFHLHNHSVKVQENAWFPNNTTQKVLPNLTGNYEEYLQYIKAQKAITNYPDLVNNKAPYFIVKTYIDSEQGKQVVCRYIQAYDPSTPVEGRADFIEDLNPLLTYPDSRAKKMEIFYVDNYTSEDYIDQENVKYKACAWVRMKEFTLTPHPYLNIAYYMDPDLHPIKLADFEQVLTTYEEDIYEVIISKTIPELKALVKIENAEEYFPNGLKVSKTDQPMVFPVENTYQVGSAEILALMSNTIAVGTGQTGNAPLYVFCKDGVYAQFVDASGQMAYLNARILARDVCNNPRSVTPIDAGVVFTTDRGLMMIAGEQVQEIGAPAEGDVVQFWNAGSVDYSKIATASMQQIAGLPSDLCSTTDFLTYLQDKGTSGKAAIINYNHNMRELMVSNPNYPYSYVLDREGNWSRRDYTASQYVNNYPTSYRVDAQGHFYKVDDEGDASTSLEHRKEADNKIFYLSNVIKLDSIGFKQAYRFVVRGYFETMVREVERVERAILQKSIDSSNFYIEDSHVLSQTNLPVMNHLVGMSDVTNGLRVGDVLVLNPIGNPLAEAQEIVITEVTRDDVYLAQDVVITEGVTGFSLSRKRTVIDHVPTNVACVVEGSYDGRKFKPLGYNRKSGKFRDIGCIVERTDVRFFRVCLAGQVTGKTRIDYMEMSAGASMLNTKIR